MELKTVAYPKVNICLYVGNRRPDGLHEILSIFQKVENFSDFITIKITDDSKAGVSVEGVDCPIEENTVYRAIKFWLDKTENTFSVEVTIDKNIPQKAGLGGGSSDAASVLLELEKINHNKLPFSELIKLGMAVGSDVPFFLYNTGAAIVSGAGEEVRPIVPRALDFYLKDSGYKKPSTAEAYAELDSLKSDPDKSGSINFNKKTELPSPVIIESIYSRSIECWTFENNFSALYPEIPDGFRLTGSGSWIFKPIESN